MSCHVLRALRDIKPNDMYRIPAHLDLGKMIGCDLNQIRLGRFDVQFVFDPAALITVQSRAICLKGDKIIASWDGEKNWDSLQFQILLNASVSSYSVVNDRTLEIQFSGDLKLQILDNSDQFESLQI
jgi:hypothetical protein